MLGVFCTKGDTFLIGQENNSTDANIHRLRIYPYTWVIFLQKFSIKGSRKFLSFECFQDLGITRNTPTYFVWPFPSW